MPKLIAIDDDLYKEIFDATVLGDKIILVPKDRLHSIAYLADVPADEVEEKLSNIVKRTGWYFFVAKECVMAMEPPAEGFFRQLSLLDALLKDKKKQNK